MHSYIQFKSQKGENAETIYNLDNFCGIDPIPNKNEIHLLTKNEDGVVEIGQVIKFDSMDEETNNQDFQACWDKIQNYFDPVRF